jgi:hypothetical protein
MELKGSFSENVAASGSSRGDERRRGLIRKSGGRCGCENKKDDQKQEHVANGDIGNA